MPKTKLSNIINLAIIALGISLLSFVTQKIGGSFVQIFYVFAFCFLAIYMSGLYFAQKILKDSPLGVQSTGAIVLGSTVFVILTVISSAINCFALVWLSILPAAIKIYELLRKKQNLTKIKSIKLSPLFAVWGILCGVYALIGAINYPHPMAIGAVIPSQDFYWNIGNAQSFMLGFPPQDLRFSGITLTYHYLTELICAGISMATGVSCYNIMAFILPVIVLAAAIMCIQKLGQALKFTKTQSALLIGLLFCTGCAGMYKLITQGKSPFNNSFLDHIITNVNSVGTCLVFLAAYMLFLFSFFKSKRTSSAFLAWLSFTLLCIAKGPIGGITAIATICVCIVLCIKKGKGKLKYLIFGFAVGATFAVLYALLFSQGSSSDVAFSFTDTLSRGYFANILNVLTIKGGLYFTIGVPILAIGHTILFMPALILPWIFCIIRDINFIKTAPHRLFCHAMGIGGMAAFLITNTGGFSQVYFSFAAIICISTLAADALPEIISWINSRKRKIGLVAKILFSSLLAISIFTAICFYISKISTGINYIFHPEAYCYTEKGNKTPLTANEERAMLWLRENMKSTEYFATNRIHTSPVTSEGLSNVYTGLSGRKSYMESFKYAQSNMGADPVETMRRYDNITTLFDKTSSSELASEICTKENIDYIVYCAFFDGKTDAFKDFDLAYDENDVKIYKTK